MHNGASDWGQAAILLSGANDIARDAFPSGPNVRLLGSQGETLDWQMPPPWGYFQNRCG